jgi:NAD(P)-dependent dehydrogenase (short-subunit alcohol dehydrogenase family)
MAGRKLAGKVAIVTGASSGVGWAAALRLAEEGVRLCVTARRLAALEALCGELTERGVDCIPVAGDVANMADVERVVGECVRQFGRVDILVNNAAVQAYAPFEALDWRQLERIFDVTFYGYLRFARAVLPHFRAQGSGHVINVLSMLSQGAAPLLSGYTAAKHALFGWQQCLRLELAGSGIDVSGVMVPSVSTPMFDHAPTIYDRAPQPVPPTYDVDVAARGVVKVAKRPNPEYVPVFLQGTLILWMQRWVPFVGDFVLGRWGDRLQMRKERINRPRGNLFEPVPQGVGPYGSVPPTARWKRWAATGVLAAAVASTALGGLRLARLAAR